MEHRTENRVPDSTYFTVKNVEPDVQDGAVVFYEGEGTRRSWGRPQANVTVLIDDCDLLAALVGFSHKHGGGQFYRYYVPGTGGAPTRKTWRSLTEDERVMVRAAYDERAPHWASSPGKLEPERKRPSNSKFTAFKVLRQTSDTTFLSLWNDTGWELGKRNAEAVGDDALREYDQRHAGGFYVHADQDRIVQLFEGGELAGKRTTGHGPGTVYVLVECECYGRRAEFSSGKVAVTYCTPVKVIREL